MAGLDRDEIATLEALYRANPEGRIFAHLAEAYRRAGEVTRARELVEEGLKRHSDYSSAHVVLGRILLDQGDSTGAEATFRRVLELDPENRVALRSLAELLVAGGRPAEAAAYYGELVLLDPGDEEAAEALMSLQGAAPGTVSEGETDAVAEVSFEELVSGTEPAFEVGDALDQEWRQVDLRPVEPLDLDFVSPTDDGIKVEPAVPLPDLEPFDLETLGVEATVADELAEVEPVGEPALDSPTVAENDPFGSDELVLGSEGFGPISLMTETMADLYASQGLVTQAAQVYRELLRERPGDESLLRKLAEVERVASEEVDQPRPGEVEAEGISEVDAEVEGAAELGLEAEVGVAAGVDAPVYAEAATELEPGGAATAVEGRTIGAYLAGLLAWGGSAGAGESAELNGEVLLLDASMEIPEDSAVSPETAVAAGDEELLLLDESMVVEEEFGEAGGGGEEGAEDEDLEVFRAWLRNLKR